MAHTEAVERDVALPAAPAEVWAAITEDDRLAAWFGAEAQMELRSGGRATFRWPDGVIRHATIEVVEPHRLLILRWFPFIDEPRGDRRPEPVTRLRFLLSAIPEGTLLQITESAPSPPGASLANHPSVAEGRGEWHNPGDLRASVPS